MISRRKYVPIFLIFIAFFMLIIMLPMLQVSQSNNQSDAISAQGHAWTSERDGETSLNVHAFYYAWYNAPDASQPGLFRRHWVHWNHAPLANWFLTATRLRMLRRHVPPIDIASSFYPKLGPYSSLDPAIIRMHMQMARFAGVGVLAVSWYPAGMSDDNGEPVDQLIPLLLDAAQVEGIKICLHVEPYRGRSKETVKANLRYVREQGYTRHPAYFHLPARKLLNSNRTLPVFFFYDSYDIPWEQWSTLLLPSGSESIRGTPDDAYMIGLLLDSDDCSRSAKAGFDGGYTYFVGQLTSMASYYPSWEGLGQSCRKAHLHLYPSIGPGYNDTTIREWNAKSTVDREAGKRYADMFHSALSASPSGLGITSFNEWHEGSQIEPARPAGPAGNNRGYRDYLPQSPDFYLRLTRLFVNAYELAVSRRQLAFPKDFNGTANAEELSRLWKLV